MGEMSKQVLHVGCGHRQSGARLPPALSGPDWREVRLDIDPSAKPDLLGSMTAMPAVADASMDAVYSSHNIEHLHDHEVPLALAEFLRVLKPDGFAVITCPDLQTAAEWIAQDRLTDVAYQSPAGPITPLDILYGYRPFLKAGNPWMLHKTGFTLKTLVGTLRQHGFAAAAGKRRTAAFDLWVVASKTALDEAALRALALRVLP